MDVHVGGDTESFASPKSFLLEVTSEALHTLDDITVEVAGDSTTVCTSFVIRSESDESLKAGVLLVITTRNENIQPELPAVRNRIVAAIERGRSKHASERLSGSQESGPSPKEALEHRPAESQSLPFQTIAVVAMLPFIALFFWRSQTQTPVLDPVSGSIEQRTWFDSLDFGGIAAFLVGGLIAAYLGTVHESKPRPYVELTGVRSAATWRRVGTSVISKAALSLVGAVVSLIAVHYVRDWLGFGPND